jgi:hypothetical protein
MAGMNDAVDAANAANMDAANAANAVEASGASVGKNAAIAADVAVEEISIASTSLIRLGTHLGHLELLGH